MKVPVVVLSLLGAAIAAPTPYGEDFLNHHLIDVNVTSDEQRQYINDLANVGNIGLDIWLYPTLVNTGRLRVPPESVDLFMQLMESAGVSAKIRHSNLKQLNDEVSAMPQTPVNYKDFIEGIIRHDAYYRFEAISSFMIGFQAFTGVNKVDLSYETYEGRVVPMLEITGGSGTNKKRIFIEAGMHAREWISPASALYFIDRLLHRRELDDDAKYLYDNFDWFIVPVSNPDGYAYTHSQNRYWRKNRNVTLACGNNVGVDLNRNFDSMWGGSGSSGSCSSDTYRGQSVFSEAESRNIRDKVKEIKQSGPINAYLSIHSFSQLLLTPYGFAKNAYPSNIDDIMDITYYARDAIYYSDSRTYRVGSPADLLYNADGGSHDWARLTESIQYSMTYELRPSSGGLSGFVLPENQIAPCSKEVWESILAIASSL